MAALSKSSVDVQIAKNKIGYLTLILVGADGFQDSDCSVGLLQF